MQTQQRNPEEVAQLIERQVGYSVDAGIINYQDRRIGAIIDGTPTFQFKASNFNPSGGFHSLSGILPLARALREEGVTPAYTYSEERDQQFVKDVSSELSTMLANMKVAIR
jgi:hypothetical protein